MVQDEKYKNKVNPPPSPPRPPQKSGLLQNDYHKGVTILIANKL